MIEDRIDLLLTDRRSYTFEGYAAQRVSAYLSQREIAHTILYLSDGILQDYLTYLHVTPPAWTWSFANLTPHHKPLCDLYQIPHFYWLEGTFAAALPFLDSAYGRVGLTDQKLCQRIAAPHIQFVPHGVEIYPEREGERSFPVILFADLIDLSALEEVWRDLLTPQERAHIQIGIEARDPLVCGGRYFAYIEQYLRAEETLQMIGRFSHLSLHIFGEHMGNNWLTRLPPHIHLHTQLPYAEHISLFQLSQCAILSPESSWYLSAVGAGCMPLPPDEEKIAFYLSHPEERLREIERRQDLALRQTWEKQAATVIKGMCES